MEFLEELVTNDEIMPFFVGLCICAIIAGEYVYVEEKMKIQKALRVPGGRKHTTGKRTIRMHNDGKESAIGYKVKKER